MKKCIFLFSLLATALCLSACGSKDFNMTFEEAVEVASHSALQDVLASSDNFEQKFDISGKYDNEWNIIDAKINSNSKQNRANNNSESSTSFDVNITAEWENVKINWALDLKVVNDAVYLNLTSLDLTWSENLSMFGMMVEWFKSQWFSIPITGLSDIPNSFSAFKDSDRLSNEAKEMIINDWSTVYSWKFSQFNWYNAWKFSLDNEKLNALIKEYYTSISSGNLDEETNEIPELNIQNFEWYLVISWKDKVTTVIENMAIVEDEILISVNWFAGEDFELYFSEWEESLIELIAHKNWSKYSVSANVADTISLNWTVSPKLSKNSIDLKFDATLTVKSETEWKNDIVIPFNGTWSYDSISSFTVSAPESAQDLTELLWSYLWGMTWWDWLDYEYDEFTDEFGSESDLNSSDDVIAADEAVEAAENVEISDNVEEPEMAE